MEPQLELVRRGRQRLAIALEHLLGILGALRAPRALLQLSSELLEFDLLRCVRLRGARCRSPLRLDWRVATTALIMAAIITPATLMSAACTCASSGDHTRPKAMPSAASFIAAAG